MYCKNCGKEIDDKAVICVHCGVATGFSLVTIGNNNWLVALLLCIFLGMFGGHRFYTKHVGLGIAQLLLTISCIFTFITFIWIIIDLIMIISGKFKTADGQELIK